MKHYFERCIPLFIALIAIAFLSSISHASGEMARLRGKAVPDITWAGGKDLSISSIVDGKSKEVFQDRDLNGIPEIWETHSPTVSIRRFNQLQNGNYLNLKISKRTKTGTLTLYFYLTQDNKKYQLYSKNFQKYRVLNSNPSFDERFCATSMRDESLARINDFLETSDLTFVSTGTEKLVNSRSCQTNLSESERNKLQNDIEDVIGSASSDQSPSRYLGCMRKHGLGIDAENIFLNFSDHALCNGEACPEFITCGNGQETCDGQYNERTRTPHVCRPLENYADVVFHELTHGVGLEENVVENVQNCCGSAQSASACASVKTYSDSRDDNQRLIAEVHRLLPEVAQQVERLSLTQTEKANLYKRINEEFIAELTFSRKYLADGESLDPTQLAQPLTETFKQILRDIPDSAGIDVDSSASRLSQATLMVAQRNCGQGSEAINSECFQLRSTLSSESDTNSYSSIQGEQETGEGIIGNESTIEEFEEEMLSGEGILTEQAQAQAANATAAQVAPRLPAAAERRAAIPFTEVPTQVVRRQLGPGVLNPRLIAQVGQVATRAATQPIAKLKEITMPAAPFQPPRLPSFRNPSTNSTAASTLAGNSTGNTTGGAAERKTNRQAVASQSFSVGSAEREERRGGSGVSESRGSSPSNGAQGIGASSAGGSRGPASSGASTGGNTNSSTGSATNTRVSSVADVTNYIQNQIDAGDPRAAYGNIRAFVESSQEDLQNLGVRVDLLNTNQVYGAEQGFNERLQIGVQNQQLIFRRGDNSGNNTGSDTATSGGGTSGQQ